MDAHTLIRSQLRLSLSVLQTYLRDFDDRELLVRPTPRANHAAWQLGHLVESHHRQLSAIAASPAPLPPDFALAHQKSAAALDAREFRWSKRDYLHLLAELHAYAESRLASLSPIELDQPAPPPLRDYLSTIGDVLGMLSGHELMHAGQIAAIRRALGKPIVM